MTNHKACKPEIRRHFAQINCEVRISKDGRITYRPEGEKNWRDGRYIEEYDVIDGQVVHR